MGDIKLGFFSGWTGKQFNFLVNLNGVDAAMVVSVFRLGVDTLLDVIISGDWIHT